MDGVSKAQAVRDYLSKNIKATPKEVVIALTSNGVELWKQQTVGF